MLAMVLEKLREPLKLLERPDPRPAPDEVRVRVSACGVCRTDLHVVDGELPNPKLPIVPGHEIIGRIDLVGHGVLGLEVGMRVGIPWLGEPAGIVNIAATAEKTSVTSRYSPAIRATAALPPMP